MATIVNSPAPATESEGSTNMIIVAVLLIAALFLFFVYGLPLIEQGLSQSGGTQINIPDKIDLNVNQSK